MSYFDGLKTAHLKPEQVHVNWLKHPPVLALTNNAFKLYRHGWDRARKAPTDLSTAMRLDLKDAATTGWSMIYSADLKAVFKHLEDNQGHWREDWADNYCGPQVVGALNVPVGVCNFLNAIDARAKTLQSSYSDLATYVRDVGIASKNKRWDQIGTYTETMQHTVKNTEKFLWMVPNYSGNSQLGSWTEGFGKVHSFLSNYNKFRFEMSQGKVQAIVISSLVEVIKHAVPIFGDIYGKAIEAIPGLAKWATGIRDERERTIHLLLGR